WSAGASGSPSTTRATCTTGRTGSGATSRGPSRRTSSSSSARPRPPVGGPSSSSRTGRPRRRRSTPRGFWGHAGCARPRRSSGTRTTPTGSTASTSRCSGARRRSRRSRATCAASSPQATTDELASAVGSCHGDVVFLDFFIPERVLRALYQAAEGVLANSEKEPFGLVGLEVMASGGIVYVGRTGEDYAVPFGNCVVMQSDDPRELLTAYQTLRTRPERAVAL